MGAGTGPVPFKETAVFLYVPWAAKRLADSLVAAEPGIDLLLHSLVSDVVVDDGRIRALVLATKQGPKAIEGRVFVDCTGDADVATFAGVQTELGPPGQRQFGSMQFVMQHVDARGGVRRDRATSPRSSPSTVRTSRATVARSSRRSGRASSSAR